MSPSIQSISWSDSEDDLNEEKRCFEGKEKYNAELTEDFGSHGACGRHVHLRSDRELIDVYDFLSESPSELV